MSEIGKLVIERHLDESFVIGTDARVTVVRMKKRGVRLMIEAPKSVRILRSELIPEEPKE